MRSRTGLALVAALPEPPGLVLTRGAAADRHTDVTVIT
jgi:hypothetical protein